MRAHWRWLSAALLVFALARPAVAGTPREFIQDTADRVLEILRDQTLDSNEKIRRLEQLAYERFDFQTTARLVLGMNWRQLSSAQQSQFVEEFKKHLSVTYGRYVNDYRDQTTEIIGERAEARGDWTVKTKILPDGGKNEFYVDYRLRKFGDEWKMIDVVTEHISLIANFRSQFQDIVSKRGIDGMLALLHEKNASGESILPPQKPGDRSGSLPRTRQRVNVAYGIQAQLRQAMC